jgi:hypothetical protein
MPAGREAFIEIRSIKPILYTKYFQSQLPILPPFFHKREPSSALRVAEKWVVVKGGVLGALFLGGGSEVK